MTTYIPVHNNTSNTCTNYNLPHLNSVQECFDSSSIRQVVRDDLFFLTLIFDIHNLRRSTCLTEKTPVEEISRTDNYHSLEQSFLRHHGKKDGSIWEAFKEMANLICRWSIRDSFVQVNRINHSLKFSVLITGNITVNVTKFFEEQDDIVFFSLFHEKELLVSDSSTLDELSRKILQIESQDE